MIRVNMLAPRELTLTYRIQILSDMVLLGIVELSFAISGTVCRQNNDLWLALRVYDGAVIV